MSLASAIIGYIASAFAAGAVKPGFDMVTLTPDLSCMIAGALMQFDEFRSRTV
jgi:4-hydroxy-2-oxoheptanedioate aldolase